MLGCLRVLEHLILSENHRTPSSYVQRSSLSAFFPIYSFHILVFLHWKWVVKYYDSVSQPDIELWHILPRPRFICQVKAWHSILPEPIICHKRLTLCLCSCRCNVRMVQLLLLLNSQLGFKSVDPKRLDFLGSILLTESSNIPPSQQRRDLPIIITLKSSPSSCPIVYHA
jgi:hypothetical protein